MKHRSPSLLLVLGAAAALTSFAACSQSGNDSSNAAASTAPVASMAAASPASGGNGAQLYAANCASCHQANGQGMPGAFPPLAGNAAVTGDAKTVIHIVKYGLTGKIGVSGKNYNGMMPAWGAQLGDDGVASVVSYIRTSWGNAAGAVTAAGVGAVSK